eukprot:6130429-Amphidinium_carterae.1
MKDLCRVAPQRSQACSSSPWDWACQNLGPQKREIRKSSKVVNKHQQKRSKQPLWASAFAHSPSDIKSVCASSFLHGSKHRLVNHVMLLCGPNENMLEALHMRK